MTFVINYSKQSKKFLKKNSHIINKTQVQKLFTKVVLFKYLSDTNIDLKRLKGRYDGLYRIRFGNIRIIFSQNGNNDFVVFDIHEIGHRGSVYK